MDYNCIELHLQHHLQHKSPHFRIASLVILLIILPTLAADDVIQRIDPLGKQKFFNSYCQLACCLWAFIQDWTEPFRRFYILHIANICQQCQIEQMQNLHWILKLLTLPSSCMMQNIFEMLCWFYSIFFQARVERQWLKASSNAIWNVFFWSVHCTALAQNSIFEAFAANVILTKRQHRLISCFLHSFHFHHSDNDGKWKECKCSILVVERKLSSSSSNATNEMVKCR